jgi:hypothetical protein
MTQPRESTHPLRVLFVATDLSSPPWDAAAGQPAAKLAMALADLGLAVTLVMPRPMHADPGSWGLAKRLLPVPIEVRGETVPIAVHDGQLGGSRAHLIMAGKNGEGDAGQEDLTGLTCMIAVQLCQRYRYWPDVIHTHGWSAVPALLTARATDRGPRPATVASLSEFNRAPGALRAALAAADRITAPSPQLARELVSDREGSGVLIDISGSRARVRGILSGLDVAAWSPERDPALAQPFSAADLTGKAAAARRLRRAVHLPRLPMPLIGIGWPEAHFDIDELMQLADSLAGCAAQLVFSCAGDHVDFSALRALVKKHPTRLALAAAGGPAFTRQLLAGSDFVVVANRFDPRGEHPLRCMPYGAIPISGPRSGLADTLVDIDPYTLTGTALFYSELTAASLLAAVRRAAVIFHLPQFATLVARVMQFDVSWRSAARRYASLYRELGADQSLTSAPGVIARGLDLARAAADIDHSDA